MKQVLSVIHQVQADFLKILTELQATGGLTQERYVRFLSMQYHLTNGVQRHFFAMAANPAMAAKKSLRRFLLNFGDEEETHFQIAQKDIENLGQEILPVNLDVRLWWAFFDRIVNERPFIRLGATCILENISTGSGDIIKKLIGESGYLNPRNTRFLVIHQHEDLPHGAQIIEALEAADLNRDQLADLLNGAKWGSTMYLRMFHWVVTGKE